MPGFHLSIYDSELPLKEVSIDEHDGSVMIFQHQNCSLKMNFYPGYPYDVFVFGETKVLLEGMIYNRTKEEIRNFLATVCVKPEPDQKEIENWLHSVDGEFVCVILNTIKGKVQIFNDLFGRLPVYYAQSEGKTIISRDIASLRASVGESDYDRFSVASTLIFGFVPGIKTLWKGINRLTPASMMKLDAFSNQNLSIQKICDFADRTENKEVKTSELLDLLTNATQNRIRNLPNPALSLSGGLDSRLIAGILDKNKLSIPSCTYQDEEGSANSDIESVTEMIKVLGIQDRHTFIKLTNAGKSDQDELLLCKQGLNYLGMAFLVPYLNYFKDNHLQQITGDGGDKVVADLRPLVRLRSRNDLWQYLLRKHSFGSVSNILKLCSISEREYREELEEILFEEGLTNMEDVYIRFLLKGRAQVWLFEGEDRNRFFSWSTTPFYNPEFALKALNLPMKSKASGKIFLAMFRELGSGLEQISNPNWKLSLDRQAAIRKLHFKQKLKYSLPYFVQRILSANQKLDLQMIHPELKSMIESSLREADVPDWFDWQAQSKNWLRNEDLGWHLLTILKLWKR
jgi:asparagine synthase (glutamine-hydrolysing)